MGRRLSGNGGAGNLRARVLSARVQSITGLITTVSKFGLLSSVAFAKTGGNANLSINSATGGVSAAAAIAVDASQTINGTATGADGVVLPFALTVTGGVALAALTMSGSTIWINAAPGATIGAVLGKAAGSTLTLLDDAGGAVSLVSGNIVVGSHALAIGTLSISILETLASSISGPRLTPLTISVTAVPTIYPNTPIADVALRASTANGTIGASYIDAGTMSIPAGEWAVGMAYYIPSGQSFNAALFSLGDVSDTLAMNSSNMLLQGNHTAGTVQPFLGSVTFGAKDDAGVSLQPRSPRTASAYYWTGTANVRLLRGPKSSAAAPFGSSVPALVVVQKTADGYVEYWIVEPGATAWCFERQYNPSFGAIAAKQLMIGRYNRATAGNVPNTANVSLQRFFRTSKALSPKQIEQIASGVDPRALVTMTQAQGDRLIALSGTAASQVDLVSGQTISLIGGTFVAAAVTPIPSTIAADTVRVKLPGYGQVIQSTGPLSDVHFEGTSLSDEPVYLQIVDSTTPATVVTPWQLVATPANGGWAGQMTNAPRLRQWYALQTRSGLTGTVTTVPRRFGVGYVVSLLGQSWHERFRVAPNTTVQAPAAGFTSRFIRTQDTPYDLGWMTTNIMGYGEATFAECLSIAFGGCAGLDVPAVNGSPIAAWQPDDPAFQESLDGILLNRIRDIFWQQGQGSTGDGYAVHKAYLHSMFEGYKAAIPHPFRFHVSLLAPCATSTVGLGITNEIQRAQRDFVAERRAMGDLNVYDVCDIQDCALESTGLHALDTAAGVGKMVERYAHHLKWLEGLETHSACGPTIAGIVRLSPTVFRVAVNHNGGTGLQTPNVGSVQGFEASLNADMSSPLTITSVDIFDANHMDVTIPSAPAGLPYITYQANYPGRIKTLDANGYMDNIGGNRNPVYDNRTSMINTTLGFPVRQMLTPMRAVAAAAPVFTTAPSLAGAPYADSIISLDVGDTDVIPDTWEARWLASDHTTELVPWTVITGATSLTPPLAVGQSGYCQVRATKNGASAIAEAPLFGPLLGTFIGAWFIGTNGLTLAAPDANFTRVEGDLGATVPDSAVFPSPGMPTTVAGKTCGYTLTNMAVSSNPNFTSPQLRGQAVLGGGAAGFAVQLAVGSYLIAAVMTASASRDHNLKLNDGTDRHSINNGAALPSTAISDLSGAIYNRTDLGTNALNAAANQAAFEAAGGLFGCGTPVALDITGSDKTLSILRQSSAGTLAGIAIVRVS